MSKFKMSLNETVVKRIDIEVEVPDGTTYNEMDKLCSHLEKGNEFYNHLIEDLKIKGYKVTEVNEGPEEGEIEIDELEEMKS